MQFINTHANYLLCQYVHAFVLVKKKNFALNRSINKLRNNLFAVKMNYKRETLEPPNNVAVSRAV